LATAINDLIESAKVKPMQAVSPFSVLSFDQLLNFPPKQFLMQGLLGNGDTVMIYGPPKSKKSLVMLDMAAALITGRQFADRFDVNQPVNVLYCYGEGHGGYPNRLRALDHKWKLSDEERARLKFVPQAPGLFDPDNDRHIQHFAKYLASLDGHGDWLNGGLLVIDTFARATQGGNENDTGDMSAMVDHFDQAKRALGCTGMMVHHENKGGGMRGNTALPGALDAFFRSVPGSDKSSGHLAFDEAKDQPEFPHLGWSLRVHEWLDEVGQSHTGPFLEWTGVQESSGKNGRGDWREEAVETIRLYCRGEGDARTVPSIHGLLVNPISEKSLGPFLADLAKSKTSCVQMVIKNSRKEDGTNGKEAKHFYWDYQMEVAP
jgi:hypothetical protein